VAKRSTPIERAIAGEPSDRRKRYEAKMRAKGFKRVSFLVPPDSVELLHNLAKLSRTLPAADFEALMDELLNEANRGSERPQRSEDAPRPAARQAHG
jgi:hypothetical protein